MQHPHCAITFLQSLAKSNAKMNGIVNEKLDNTTRQILLHQANHQNHITHVAGIESNLYLWMQHPFCVIDFLQSLAKSNADMNEFVNALDNTTLRNLLGLLEADIPNHITHVASPKSNETRLLAKMLEVKRRKGDDDAAVALATMKYVE